MRGHERSDGLIGDYCDGSDFKIHPLFSSHKNALQILLYYDEVEVCNPLGTKVKIHKLGIVILTNIPNHHNVKILHRSFLLSSW